MNTANNTQRVESQNDFFRFLEIKTEKLVTAVYMITNFLSDKEPMKWRLRDICLSTLSNASVLKEKNPSEQSQLLTGILASGGEIISMLEIAHLSGFISEMNYTVLRREYVNMMQQIAQREEVQSTLSKLSLPEALFAEEGGEALPHPVQTAMRNTEEGAQQGSVSASGYAGANYGETHRGYTYPMSTHTLKDRNVSAGQTTDDLLNQQNQKDTTAGFGVKTGEDKKIGRVEKVKNKRREIIIQMLRDKKDLSIKDIAAEITDCSEKTIQRELVELLKKGIIKKTGERRWSRYSLV